MKCKWELDNHGVLNFPVFQIRTLCQIKAINSPILKNSLNCCRTNCKWNFKLKMGQTLGSCFGCVTKSKKKSTAIFEEVTYLLYVIVTLSESLHKRSSNFYRRILGNACVLTWFTLILDLFMEGFHVKYCGWRKKSLEKAALELWFLDIRKMKVLQ